MKTLVTKRTVIIVSIAMLIAIISIISVNIFSSSGPVTGAASIISRPFRMLASNVARVFENIYSSIYRYEDLMEAYEILARDLVDRERDYREAEELREENERLRSLLEFRGRNTGYDHEPATVESVSGGNWTSSFVINRGYMNSNVARGMGVATEYGALIGQITEVGATTSIFVSILDTTFSAGAYVGDGEGTATVKGDFALMSRGLLMLDHIDDDLGVLPGQNVVTSGRGGIFPPGLVVGTVVEVIPHSTGVGRYATVRPLREIDTIVYVYVITDFEFAERDTE